MLDNTLEYMYSCVVFQGKNNHALVLLSQPHGYIGTYIANAAEDIATQVTNLFGLDPRTTIYLQNTPPKVPQVYEGFEDDPLANILRSIRGAGDEKYERVTFQWKEADTDEPILERYHAYGGEPYWKPILPGDAAKLLEELNM